MKHRSIQLDYRHENEMINSYYRKKNHEQVLQYKSMIQDEDNKSEENNFKSHNISNLFGRSIRFAIIGSESFRYNERKFQRLQIPASSLGI